MKKVRESVDVPKLVWGAAILAAVNLVIGCCVALAPDLDVRLEGVKKDPPGAYAAAKPSPFEYHAIAKPRKPRSAQMLIPVLHEEPAYSSYDLDIPRSSLQPAVYLSGSERLQAIN